MRKYGAVKAGGVAGSRTNPGPNGSSPTEGVPARHTRQVSTNYLRLIPTDPTWLPTAVQVAEATVVVRRLAPASESIISKIYDSTTLIDAGANAHSVYCPGCGREIDWAWWQTQMDVASKTDFTDLGLTTACCGLATTLNDLRYVWPQGFSCWVLEVTSPGRMTLTDEEIAHLGDVLGHEIREIWSHI